eukprot:12341007-Karenia_brevis.AAC.1
MPNYLQGINFGYQFSQEEIPLWQTLCTDVFLEVKYVALWRACIEPATSFLPAACCLRVFLVGLAC